MAKARKSGKLECVYFGSGVIVMMDVLMVLAAVALQAGGSGEPTEPTDPIASAESAATAVATSSAEAPMLVAEPQEATGRFTTATEVRPILTATRGNWVSVREYDGQDLVYVTHLWAWRCGLVQLKLGINGAAPQLWPLPACHTDTAQPNGILDTDGLPYRSFNLQSVDTVTVEITYDDLTTDMVTVNRLGQPQP